jgi:hypothetical protein
MKKIRDYDPFFDFFYFFFKTLARHQKKNHNPKSVGNVQAGKFLKYWNGKDRNTLAIKSAEKKGRLLTELTFFLPHYGNANYLTSAPLATLGDYDCVQQSAWFFYFIS